MMNGNRVLRTTVVTVLTASTVIGSTMTGHAEENAEPSGEGAAQAVHQSVRSTENVHRGVWSTRAQPRARSRARTAKGRNKAIAFRLVSRRAWSQNQFRCLDSLWTRESNWNHRAQNRSSGAYGIPQALPGSKMGGSGGDWRSNPATQIHWGLRYIKSRYGSPCGAWGHFRSRNWY
ncbi:hypothetical protein Pta02_12400 [Planobispora takensis]|uniref:Transglycosylase SLT domain-containing protein n=2 Tax=Planobispora takensis TaxID=1367882 RepID=A0A8J3SUG4_9ACTN|nr:hypothetical protein Pta02_12400 [Planobispora takensis]